MWNAHVSHVPKDMYEIRDMYNRIMDGYNGTAYIAGSKAYRYVANLGMWTIPRGTMVTYQ